MNDFLTSENISVNISCPSPCFLILSGILKIIYFHVIKTKWTTKYYFRNQKGFILFLFYSPQDWDWIYGKTPKFHVKKKMEDLSAVVHVNKGRIEGVILHMPYDWIDPLLVQQLTSALKGKGYLTCVRIVYEQRGNNKIAYSLGQCCFASSTLTK